MADVIDFMKGVGKMSHNTCVWVSLSVVCHASAVESSEVTHVSDCRLQYLMKWHARIQFRRGVLYLLVMNNKWAVAEKKYAVTVK